MGALVMVDDALLEREHLSDEEWYATPKPEHLTPGSMVREQASDEFQEQLQEDPPAICITHGDADGLTSAALVAAMEGPDTAIRTVSHQGAYRFPHAIQDLQETSLGVTKLYITDFSPDDRGTADVLGGVIEENNAESRVEWYDHHQWDNEVREAVEGTGVELHIDTDECASSLLAREADHGFHEHVRDLVAVTKDIDLWIREDERSPRLNVWAEIAEPAEYVTNALEHGADHSDGVSQRIDERLAELEELEAEAIRRATHHSVGKWNVATTYIRDGRSSEIGNYLVEEHDGGADIAAVHGPDAELGIYSHSNREGFGRCHEIAAELGGGGHPTAAGCAVPLETFDDLAQYWQTTGQSSRPDILDAIRAVVRTPDDETDGPSEWSAEDVKAEVHSANESVRDVLEPAFVASKAWVKYEGERGGSGWKNTETGEVVYQDEKPGGGEGGGRDLAELANDEGLLDADDLQVGDEVLIHGDEVTLDGVVGDETGAIVQFEKGGENFFLYEDMVDIEAPGFEPGPSPTDGSGSASGGGGSNSRSPDDGPQFEPGEEIESPDGEPATVVDYDPATDIVAYEGDAYDQVMMAPADSIAGDDGSDTDSADEGLADELGVEWVDTDGLDDGQIETVTSAFESYHENQGIGDHAIVSVSTTPPEDVGVAAGASFTPNSRKLYINPDGLDAETHREDYEAGYLSTETPEGTIYHELAHANHSQAVLRDSDLDYQELQNHEFTDDRAELITDEVSWYASTSASELVAEVSAGIQEGNSYSNEIMELYEQFGGPEVAA